MRGGLPNRRVVNERAALLLLELGDGLGRRGSLALRSNLGLGSGSGVVRLLVEGLYRVFHQHVQDGARRVRRHAR